MAVGTVSGIETENNWQLIASASPTSGTTAASFTSIAGYSRVMVVWKALRASSGAWLFLKVNNDTTAGNYAGMAAYTSASNFESESLIPVSGFNGTNHSGAITIENVNQSTPHQISNFAAYQTSQFTGAILNSSPITRIDLYINTSALTGGTVELWGVAG
jgi:hypothetical protein